MVAVETVRVRAGHVVEHAESLARNVFAVEVGRRWRDTESGYEGAQLPASDGGGVVVVTAGGGVVVVAVGSAVVVAVEVVVGRGAATGIGAAARGARRALATIRMALRGDGRPAWFATHRSMPIACWRCPVV
jgi:hypothetical protein